LPSTSTFQEVTDVPTTISPGVSSFTVGKRVEECALVTIAVGPYIDARTIKHAIGYFSLIAIAVWKGSQFRCHPDRR
jgi:hypothetical protein